MKCNTIVNLTTKRAMLLNLQLTKAKIQEATQHFSMHMLFFQFKVKALAIYILFQHVLYLAQMH